MIRAISLDIRALAYGPAGADLLSEILMNESIGASPEEVADAVSRLPEQVVQLQKAIRTEEQEDDYYRTILPLLLRNLGVTEPTEDLLIQLGDAIHEYPAYWSLYPETLPVLEQLRARGLRLAVVANWDPSLPRFLREFELDDYFAGIFCSGATGLEKQGPYLFAHALRKLGLSADDVLHVGPSISEDVAGAMAAGIHPVWLNRLEIPSGHEVVSINNLTGLLLLAGAEKAGH